MMKNGSKDTSATRRAVIATWESSQVRIDVKLEEADARIRGYLAGVGHAGSLGPSSKTDRGIVPCELTRNSL